jgi:3-oxoacyl-[acyl-carrier-protein] synthase III
MLKEKNSQTGEELMSFTITGTGRALPEQIISNEEMSQIVDTSHEWIYSRTGIQNRRIARNETMTQLCVQAARKALDDAGTLASELDLILCATLRGDYLTPSQACLIQQGIGASCPAFDINAACSGFIYALDVAQSYFASGKVRKVLIVAYELMSRMLDWKNRNTCVLFGDGGGAVVLESGTDLLGIHLTAQGNKEILSIPNTQGDCPFGEQDHEPQYLRMSGPEVFKFAVNKIVEELEAVITQNSLRKEEIDLVLLHQANLRIIDFARQRLGMDQAKFVSNLDQYGNTSAGSIPILLDELAEQNKLHKGSLIALVAFGGGLTTGACILRWNKDKRTTSRSE